MGPVQRGLLLLTTLSKEWPIIVIDIKDCFFSILLSAQDTERFAFTLPAINQEQPDKRYEWVVLPQEMANSPTMCQIYVDRAIQPVRQAFRDLKCFHYMDDILMAHREEQVLKDAYSLLVDSLKAQGLIIAPEKVQQDSVVSYLGAKIGHHQITAQKIEIRKDGLKSLNDFQKLLGAINWLCPYLKLTNYQLQPLYDILRGDPALDSPRVLSPEGRAALKTVEELARAFLQQCEEGKDITLVLLKTKAQPTAVIWQNGPLKWIQPKSSITKTIQHYPTAVAILALEGIQQCFQHFGIQPTKIIVPYTQHQVQLLCATLDDWAILVCSCSGSFDNHYPQNPLLRFFEAHPHVFPKVTKNSPIARAMVIYTDGSKTGCGSYKVDDQDAVLIQFGLASPQIIEL